LRPSTCPASGERWRPLWRTRERAATPSTPVINSCHQFLPSILAINPCHQSLPSILAINPCHQSLPSILAINP
jgi:hypothetical protein